MAQPHLTPRLDRTEEAITVLFCLVDDAYRLLNPRGERYASLKRMSDSEVLALALFQQLRGVESEQSFLREAERFFAHLFPGVVGLWPSSLNRRLRKPRRFLEPLRRAVVPELVGEPETLIVDSTLLEVSHPRQVKQSAGFDGAAWVRWGSFSVYGMKLHLLCASNGVPVSYELTPANAAEVRLTEELLAEARLGEEVGRRLLGDLAYRSEGLEETLAECGVLLVTERADQHGERQRVEICFSSLKRVFGLGETLAKTLVGLATRIGAKMAAYTYGFYVNRLPPRQAAGADQGAVGLRSSQQTSSAINAVMLTLKPSSKRSSISFWCSSNGPGTKNATPSIAVETNSTNPTTISIPT